MKSSVENKLKFFKTLKPDWDGYGADPISDLTIENTRNLLSKLKGDWEIFPVNTGAIQVEKNLDKIFCIEIEVSESGYTFMFFKYNVEVGNNCYTIESGKKFKLDEIDDLIKEIEKCLIITK